MTITCSETDPNVILYGQLARAVRGDFSDEDFAALEFAGLAYLNYAGMRQLTDAGLRKWRSLIIRAIGLRARESTPAHGALHGKQHKPRVRR